jgi:hypothetical protein
MEAQVQNAVEVALNPGAEYTLKQQVFSKSIYWLISPGA